MSRAVGDRARGLRAIAAGPTPPAMDSGVGETSHANEKESQTCLRGESWLARGAVRLPRCRRRSATKPRCVASDAAITPRERTHLPMIERWVAAQLEGRFDIAAVVRSAQKAAVGVIDGRSQSGIMSRRWPSAHQHW